MRLLRVRLKDIGRFRGEREIDFDAIPDGLVCLVGANGAGKTTFLEASAPAVLFREFPTRLPGGFLDLANSRDSMVEMEYEAGNGDTVRLTLRGDKGTGKGTNKGKQECYVHVNGTLIDETTGGKTAPYDAWVQEHIASRAMFYANWFAVQKPGMLRGVGQFQNLSKTDRSSLFTEMLGIGHLQGLAETATKGAGILSPLVERFTAALDANERRMEEAGSLTDELSGLRIGLEEATIRLREARSTLDAATKERDGLREATAATAAAGKAVREKRERLASRELDFEAVDHDLIELGRALEDEDILRAAAKDAVEIKEQVENLRADYQREKAIGDGLDERLKAAREKDETARRRVMELERYTEAGDDARKRLDEEFADLAPMEDAEAAVTEAEAAFDARREEERAANDAHSAAREKATGLERAEERLQAAKKAAELLGGVPCGGDDDYAGCQFLTDATKGQADIPGLQARVEELQQELEGLGDTEALARDATTARGTAGETQREARAALEARRKLQTTVEDLERQIATAAEKASELEAAEKESKAAQAGQTAALDAIPAQKDKVASIVQRGQSLAADLKEAQAQSAGVEELDANRARHEEKKARSTELRKEIEKLEADLADTPEEASVVEADLTQAEDAVHEATRGANKADDEARDYQTQIDRKDAVLGTYGDLQATRVVLQERNQRLQMEIGVWATLAQALGRNGIQILEIDAAGPRVAAVANQLLEETLGARFRVEIVTTKLRKSARAGADPYKDVFSIDVLDGDLGIRGDLLNMSGGEEVFVGDALREALTIVANERRTDPILTLWGDEPTGALSEANAGKYVERKRAAMRIGGIRQMVLVSHQREIWEQADWILWFNADGSIESIPTAEAIGRRMT